MEGGSTIDYVWASIRKASGCSTNALGPARFCLLLPFPLHLLHLCQPFRHVTQVNFGSWGRWRRRPRGSG